MKAVILSAVLAASSVTLTATTASAITDNGSGCGCIQPCWIIR